MAEAVYAGDTIRYDVTLTEARPSRTRPGGASSAIRRPGRTSAASRCFASPGSWLRPEPGC